MLDPRLASLFGLKQSDLSCGYQFKRGLFKYPGGKWDSLPYLMPHLPYRGAFIDVFGGSGCVLLSRNTEKLMVFNDLNSCVVDFYRVVREDPEGLLQRLYLMPHSREEWEEFNRTWNDKILDRVERAARWYYVIQYSFVGKSQSFGRITGKSKTAALSRVAGTLVSKLPEFLEVHERIQRVQIESLDFRVCLKDYEQPNAVFYCDPPYYGADMSSYDKQMSKTDHIELLETIQHMKCFVAISGYENDLYDSYDWDDKVTWHRRDRCDSQAASDLNHKDEDDLGIRGNREEVLWIHDPKG